MHSIALQFRRAIEQVGPRDTVFAAMKSFPKGCCKDTSFLLARILNLRYGVHESRYVYGTRAAESLEWYTHGWLETAGYILDVTADQFEEVSEKVMVTPIGESEFHDSWSGQCSSAYPRFWSFNDEAGPQFEETLELLMAAMASSQVRD